MHELENRNLGVDEHFNYFPIKYTPDRSCGVSISAFHFVCDMDSMGVNCVIKKMVRFVFVGCVYAKSLKTLSFPQRWQREKTASLSAAVM